MTPPAGQTKSTPLDAGLALEKIAKTWIVALAILLAIFVATALSLQDQPFRLTLYVCAYATIAMVYFAYSAADQGFDVLHPSFGLFLLLFLYSLSSALFVETEKTTFYKETLVDQVYAIYYWACGAGAAGLAIGLSVRRLSGVATHQSKHIASHSNVFLRNTMLWCCLVLCVVFLPFIYSKFNFFAVRSYYEIALSSRVERLADDSAGVIDVLTLYLPLTILLATCAYAIQNAEVKTWQRLAAFVVFGAYVLTGFLAGERYTILYCGVVMLAYRHFRIQRVSALQAIVGGFIGYVLMNLIPIIRGSANPALMLQVLMDTLGSEGLNDFSLTYSNELVTATNLHRHIQGMLLGETTYNYGYSLVTDLLVWIPRLIYPNRPLPISEQFVEVFYPGVRDMGGGYGFFIIQEGYWAFGVFGAFVFMAFFGWIVDGLYRAVLKFQQYDLVLILYAAVYADIVMASIRSGIVGSFKAALLHAFPFVFVLVVHAIRLRWRAHRAPSARPVA